MAFFSFFFFSITSSYSRGARGASSSGREELNATAMIFGVGAAWIGMTEVNSSMQAFFDGSLVEPSFLLRDLISLDKQFYSSKVISMIEIVKVRGKNNI